MRQDDVRRERGQFCCVPANFAGIGRGPANVDAHVAADGPSQQRQLLQERPDPGLPFRIVRSCGQEHADPTDALTLLSARRERPRDRRAAEQRDERAPLQLIELHWVALPAGLQDIELAGISQRAYAYNESMRSILLAMMKSFSCSPLIFLVLNETVA